MMVPVVLFAALATVFLLAVSPIGGWIAAMVLKSTIDIGWSPEFAVMGLSPLEIVGAALPAIVGARMLVFRSEFAKKMPLKGPWFVYASVACLGSILYIANSDYIGGASFFLRSLNGIVAYFSIAYWFGSRDRFRWWVLALILGGLVPMCMGVYESVTGNAWRIRYGAGDQIRITGLYHNSVNYRYYAYAALTGIALYWVYFARRTNLTKLLLVVYAGMCAVVLFKVYSKAGFITIAFASGVWVLMGRRLLLPTLVVAAALIANLTMENVVVREIENTFQKDVGALRGEQASDRAFGGRLGGWRRQWKSFWSQEALAVLVGSGEVGGGREARGGGHNDYIRALFQTGIVGLVAYVWLLLATGLALAKAVIRQQTPLTMIALVVYVAWIVETIGFTPAVYTNYQWYTWGMIGLALRGVRDLDESMVTSRPQASARRAPKYSNILKAMRV